MAESDQSRRRQLAQAGLLISVGLLVQAVTLFWSHPTAFLVFIGVGGLLVAAGGGRYLWALIAGPGDGGDARR